MPTTVPDSFQRRKPSPITSGAIVFPLAARWGSCYVKGNLLKGGKRSFEVQAMGDAPRTSPAASLDAVVSEVAAEAHLQLDRLAPRSGLI